MVERCWFLLNVCGQWGGKNARDVVSLAKHIHVTRSIHSLTHCNKVRVSTLSFEGHRTENNEVLLCEITQRTTKHCYNLIFLFLFLVSKCCSYKFSTRCGSYYILNSKLFFIKRLSHRTGCFKM